MFFKTRTNDKPPLSGLLSASSGSWSSLSIAPSSQGYPVQVLQGVRTEMVIVISLASFVVGVALTALLWFLHNRLGELSENSSIYK